MQRVCKFWVQVMSVYLTNSVASVKINMSELFVSLWVCGDKKK